MFIKVPVHGYGMWYEVAGSRVFMKDSMMVPYLKRVVFFVIHDTLIVPSTDMNSDIQRR